VQNDILKEYIARGTYIFPPAPSMRLITDLFAYCGTHVPHWNTISISGYHIREAGSTAAQEIAFTLANAIEYVKAALEAGLKVDDFGPQLAFFSTRTTTSWKRSPSSARRGASGHTSCASGLLRRTRRAGNCASTRRRPAPR
jgi:methylmalonyl-CoA mutase cobalamin-binding domain/chain